MLLGGRRVVRGDFRRELHPHCFAVCDCEVQDLSWIFVTLIDQQVDKKVESTGYCTGTRYCQNFTTTSIDGIHTYQLPVPGRRSISFYLERKHQGINAELIQKYVANGLQSIGNNFTQAMRSKSFLQIPSENNLTVDINFFILLTIHVIIYYLHLFLAFVPVARSTCTGCSNFQDQVSSTFFASARSAC